MRGVGRHHAAAVSAGDRAWLPDAVAYVADWLGFQVRNTWQPGAVVAVAVVDTDGGGSGEGGAEVVHASAHGVADLGSGDPLTTEHRFRVASHSKTVAAVAVLRLRELGQLRLDDPVGRHVDGLHPAVAAATVEDVLTHTAGLTRDGTDTGQWVDRRPFLDDGELRAVLAEAPVLERAERFKYSNIGYGLIGLVVAAVTGAPYGDWVAEHVIGAAGLAATAPDIATAGGPLASGHSAALPLGHRVVVPARNPTGALAAATGLVTTAPDLARFVAQLHPGASRSVLSPASRRELVRRRWVVPDDPAGRGYGLGTIVTGPSGREVVGHSGAFQGVASRTALDLRLGVSVCVCVNAIDGPAWPWCEGALGIIRRFADDGPPDPGLASWRSRWWDLWSVTDLVPVGGRVLAANPALGDPLGEAAVLAVTGPDTARIERAGGFASHGESVRRVRDASGAVVAVELAGARKLAEAAHAAEVADRYGR